MYAHEKGQAVLHFGRHRNGAKDLAVGERVNLIIWAWNSAYRGAVAFGNVPLDGSPFEQESHMYRLCLRKSNDRDYETQLKLFEV